MPWKERIPPVDFMAIKTAVPIEAVLARLGWRQNGCAGATRKGNCPIHSTGARASTSFTYRRHLWYCWTCREGGDVSRLWARIHGLSDLAAALQLCSMFGLPVPRR